MVDRYHKGRVRPYAEAAALNVIDKRVAKLVEILNCEGVIYTRGSCQGHGFPFVRVPPYVSFKTSAAIALAFDTRLQQLYASSVEKLHYCWRIKISIDDDGSLTYVLGIPDLSSGKLWYALRYCIDRDFQLIGSAAQTLLQLLNYQNSEVVSQVSQCNHT